MMKNTFYLKNLCSGSVRAKMISITIIHHSVVSLESIYLSSQKSNQGSKKKENHQNFTANPPSTFSNSWIDCKYLKKGETCRRCHRRNT